METPRQSGVEYSDVGGTVGSSVLPGRRITKAAFKAFAHLLKVILERRTNGAWEAGVIQNKPLFVSQSTENDIKHGSHVDVSLCKGYAVPS